MVVVGSRASFADFPHSASPLPKNFGAASAA
jgi:hypothetical protein